MYELDVYLSNMDPYDPDRRDKTDFKYYLPQSLVNRLSEHETWLIKCDYISMSSNISTEDFCSITFYNDKSMKAYMYKFEPSIQTTPADMAALITGVMASDAVTQICGASGKIWSFTYNKDRALFRLGKSTSSPPEEFRDSLYIIMSKRLIERLGFKSNKPDGGAQFDYKNLIGASARPYYAEKHPNLLKNMRRLYLSGDFVQSSIVNSMEEGIITSFDNPSSDGDFGFHQPVEIDRSHSNHWIQLLKSRLWRIRLTNELMENLTVLGDQDIHLKLRLKPAPGF